MKIKVFFSLMIAGIVLFQAGVVEARKSMPKASPAVIHKGVEFFVPLEPKEEQVDGTLRNIWYVEGRCNHVKIWEHPVYVRKINVDEEYENQLVYPVSLSVEENKLIVVNDRKQEYRIEIPAEALKCEGAKK